MARTSNSSHPFITVLLTTRDRAASVRRTLESLRNVDCAGIEWQVLVVDNGSADETAQTLSILVADERLPLKVLHEARPGKSRALNLGLETIAEGLVVFIDDDVLVPQCWLRAYADASTRWPDVGIFGGHIEPSFPREAPSWVRDERYVNQSPMFSRYAPLDREGLTPHLPIGPNMAIRRRAIGTHRFNIRFGPGGDYQAMGCETEFVSRLVDLDGEQIVYVPQASVEHIVRPEQLTREAIWARAYKWGRSRALSDKDVGKKVRLWGVPVKMWLSAARAFLRFAPFYFGPRHFYLKHGWLWHVRSGRVRGYRELHRKRRRRARGE